MQDAMRTYLELATGLTDASRKRARKVVKDVVGRSGATAEQARVLTTELMSSNAANREALTKLVRFEVDRALGVVGLATADEVKQLTRRVRELERQLRDAEARLAAKATTRSTARTRDGEEGAPRRRHRPRRQRPRRLSGQEDCGGGEHGDSQEDGTGHEVAGPSVAPAKKAAASRGAGRGAA